MFLRNIQVELVNIYEPDIISNNIPTLFQEPLLCCIFDGLVSV